MTAEERQIRIEEHIQQVEFASLEELAKHVGASVSTVRRDLNVLEAAGNIRRTHGGARLINPKTDEFAFTARDAHESDEKDSIGRICAELVRPGQTVILDAGTTVHHVARHFQDKRLQLVTNSIPVANLFLSAQSTEVVVSGGVLYPRLGVLVGPLAIKAFREIHADLAIMSAGGITVDGLTNSHALLIDIQRAMIDSASRVIFCLDHTKWNRKSVAFLCDLESIDTVVTDPGAPVELVHALRARGIEVLGAGEAQPEPGAPATDLAIPKMQLPDQQATQGKDVAAHHATVGFDSDGPNNVSWD
jgi:DeoR/GlpR family transcriptional regulator of sugar metabolism